MSKSERRIARGLGIAAFVAATLVFALEATGNPGEVFERALLRELALTRARTSVGKGLAALEREQATLDYAGELMSGRVGDELHRLDAYRVSKSARERQATRRARALYKLARGGFLRLALEDLEPHEGASERDLERRVVRGRSIRWLVAHDLEELAVHSRAEDRARAELLATVRELEALSALNLVATMETELVSLARTRVDPLLAQSTSERRTGYQGRTDAHARALLHELDRERRELRRHVGFDLLEDDALRRPVTGRIVGPFGDYQDPILRVPMHRKGIELGTRPGTEVVAVAPGEVAFCGELPGFDEVVVLDHGGGYLSLTGRLFTSGVEVGDEIATGQVLGRAAPKAVDDGMGTTVYFELRHAERPIDPRPWFRGGRAPKARSLALVAEEEGAEGDDYVVEEMVVLEEAAAMETTEQSE